ncbi:MAG: amino acid permease [Bacteroidetes bacterium]|nr:amino acid permease [Bacteroidota bacterium]
MSTPELKRSLGFIDATMIVAGSMIGSGIFIVTSQMARDVGSSGYILLLWLITGFITIAAALSYGELAGMMPKAGGQYVYIQRAYNPLVSFLYGWTVFTVIQTGVIAAVAVAFAKYAAVFIPSLNTVLLQAGNFKITSAQVLAIASIVFLTFSNSRGVRNGKMVQLIFTSAKVLALFAIIILGLIIGSNTDVLSHNLHDMWNATKTTLGANGAITIEQIAGWTLVGALGATIINPLFSSDAWNNVTFIAGEIKDPQKNIPRSLFVGTLVVTIIYILANVAYLALLPLRGDPNAVDVVGNGIQFADNDRVGAAAAYVIFGQSATYIMAALIMVSTFGCNNGLILSGARLFYAMGNDGLFFKKAGQLNSKEVPGFALVLQCIWASALCLSGKYGDLLEYSTFASLIFYIVTIVGIFILRRKEPDADRPYKAWGYPVLPVLYIIITTLICVDLLIYKPNSAGLGLLIVLLGVPVYFINKKLKQN